MNPNDFYNDFENEFNKQKRELKRPTILVAGYTGSGKTSLIQAICGKEIVPDDRVAAGLPKTQFFDFYENDLVRFWDSKGLEPGNKDEKLFVDETKKFVRSLQNNANVDNHIHLVWYTIQGSGARVTKCDLRLIKEIFPSVIIAITKNDITRQDQLEAMKKVLVENGIEREHIFPCSVSDKVALKQIVNTSSEMLPEVYRRAFISAQIVDLEKKKKQALTTIGAAATAAAVVGAVPLPFSDAAIITPIQIGMIAGLAIIYNESFLDLKTAILPGIFEIAGIQTASSLTKFIPFFGSVWNAGVASTFTGGLGYLMHLHLIACFNARINGKAPPKFLFDWEAFKKAIKDWLKERETNDGP